MPGPAGKPEISSSLYRAAYCFFDAVSRFYCGLEARGIEHLPARGGVLVAANHKSLLDPPFLAYCMARAGRRPYFLAKNELFRNPFLGWVMRSLGSVPLERYSADVGALKSALGLLESGQAIALFPEGTRKRKPLERFLPGIGFLALKSRAPVIPVFVPDFGSCPAFGSRVMLRFGPPIPYSEIAQCSAQEAAARVLEAVRSLSHDA